MSGQEHTKFGLEVFKVETPTFELSPMLDVQKAGYMVVSGINPIRSLRKSQPFEQYIVPADPTSKTELRPLATDAWMEAAQMALTTSNLLRFANRYGQLCPEIAHHCHSE